jgi:hypothetical protein
MYKYFSYACFDAFNMKCGMKYGSGHTFRSEVSPETVMLESACSRLQGRLLAVYRGIMCRRILKENVTIMLRSSCKHNSIKSAINGPHSALGAASRKSPRQQAVYEKPRRPQDQRVRGVNDAETAEG